MLRLEIKYERQGMMEEQSCEIGKNLSIRKMEVLDSRRVKEISNFCGSVGDR